VVFCRGIALNPRHALLQFALGQAFDSGLGVEKDDSKAVEWYRKAAEQGLVGAMYSWQKSSSMEKESMIQNRRSTGTAKPGMAEAQYALGEHYSLCEVEPLLRTGGKPHFGFARQRNRDTQNAQLRFARLRFIPRRAWSKKAGATASGPSNFPRRD
jgi:Sel1 repeat